LCNGIVPDLEETDVDDADKEVFKEIEEQAKNGTLF
jgi:hypothetical protein